MPTPLTVSETLKFQILLISFQNHHHYKENNKFIENKTKSAFEYSSKIRY